MGIIAESIKQHYTVLNLINCLEASQTCFCFFTSAAIEMSKCTEQTLLASCCFCRAAEKALLHALLICSSARLLIPRSQPERSKSVEVMEEGKRWVESEREGVGRLLLAARDLRPGEVKPPYQTFTCLHNYCRWFWRTRPWWWLPSIAGADCSCWTFEHLKSSLHQGLPRLHGEP